MRLNPFARGDNSTGDAQQDDFGFGENLSGRGVRLLDKDGKFNVLRQGVKSTFAYQWLIEMNWWKFFTAVLFYYVAINFLLGVGFFLLGPTGIAGISEGPWVEQLASCFFFSVQTFTTVGYGSMSPTYLPHQLLAGLGALIGLMSLALATGLFFARFSRPRGTIVFSKKAVIAPYADATAFEFRIASRSTSKLIDVRAQVVYSWVSTDEHGHRRRQFFALPLERDQIAMFPLNWTIVHPITGESPLIDCDVDAVDLVDGEFIVQISGFDETYARQVFAHTSYRASCLMFGYRFAPMYRASDDGRMILHLDRIDSITEASIDPERLPDDVAAPVRQHLGELSGDAS